jgi:hypothetical protein
VASAQVLIPHLSATTGTGSPQATFLDKIFKNYSMHVAIRHIRQLLEFFKEFRISGFINATALQSKCPQA